MSASFKICMYCGNPAINVSKGEHIFPKALGGVKTIRNVCSTCNNTVLSALDDELVCRSQLGMVASEILGNQFYYCWDVDYSSNSLLMESEPIFDKGGIHNMRLWPQLVLEGENLQLRADLEEMLRFGPHLALRFLLAQAKRCFDRWRNAKDKKDRKILAFERVPAGIVGFQSYRLPPRVYVKRRLPAVSHEMAMNVRYVTDDDKRRLLNRISKISSEFNLRDERAFHLGERRPQFSREWEPKAVTRALVKIGLNLLSHLCSKTKIDPTTFVEPIAFVLGKLDLPAQTYLKWGFIWPADVAQIHRSDDGHAARLVYDRMNRVWVIYFSFFGGRMAAVAHVPGPNDEDWITADVSTPLASVADANRLWKEERTNIFLPMNVHVEWEDPTKACPGIAYLKQSPNIYQRLPLRVVRKRTK